MKSKQKMTAALAPALAALMLVLVVLLSGCGGGSSQQPTTSSAPTAPATAQVDTVHAVRTSDDSSNHLAPFDYTGHNSAKVQALYTALLTLPAYAPTGKACPTDLGVQYNLSFSHGGGTAMLQAIADPSGCQVVVINGRDNRTTSHSSGFWALLAAAVGVPEAQVYPIPTA